MEKELEIYVHIPFCVRKCDYCDFLSGPATKRGQEEYFRALKNEIEAVCLEGEYKIRSIFFGGGTPSAVPGEQIASVMEELKKKFSWKEQPEVSLEANPGTLTEEKLKVYRQAGVNRLSLGCQAAHEHELKLLGRIHTWEEFQESYRMAREAGFDNINVDLMSAIPGQSLMDWEENLHLTASMKPEHISAYSLIVEEGTPFYGRELDLPDEDTERLMYKRTGEILREYGFERYEISNYARRGKECLHNIGYWKRIDYLGVGLGAASLLNPRRFSNTRIMEEYLQSSRDPEKIRRENQQLTVKEQMEEYMFLGLRMSGGIEKEDFFQTFGKTVESIYKEVLEKYVKLGLLENRGQRIFLTEEGINVSNRIFSEFLL